MKSRIYLDYCATTPVHPIVRDAVLSALEADFGNPSSLHWAGQNAAGLLKQARADVASALGCAPDEIIFTSGATEADNLAIFGGLKRLPPNKTHLITSAIEHHAVLHAAQELEREGCAVTCLPVDGRGLVDPEDVRRAIRPETALISIMLVNNEVGSIQPIAEISRIAREHGICLHTDAVQGIGLLDVDANSLGVDMLSLSAHKVYGPKGIGALYVRRGIELSPLIVGGAQEGSRRAGTENVPGILGLAAAVKLVREHRAEERARLLGLRERLVNAMQASGPGVIVNGPKGEVAPHVVSVSFEGADAEMLQIRLNQEGFAVSLGSACNSKSIEPSHVLTAMGLPREQIEATLRVSLGMFTTEAELDLFVDALTRVLPRVAV
ncbi:MAG: cysteine desulfurase [Anaerolineales bacterium]|nr:cysteine desulfurase [Anaerolineales bacterium]